MFNVLQSQNVPAIIYGSRCLSSCLILATYNDKVNKLKLLEVANQFSFENEHRFSIYEQILPRRFTVSTAKVLRGPKHSTKSVVQQRLSRDLVV